MAAPVFRAAGLASAATGTSALTVAAPAGIAAGDLEIMGSGTIDGQTVSITSNGGGAWTAHPNNGQTVASGTRIYVWYRIRAGGDSDPQVTATGDHVNASRVCYQTGTFDTSDPLEIENAGANASSDTSFSAAPGDSTAGADRLCLCFGAGRRDNNTGNFGTGANTNLTSFNRRTNHGTSNGLGSSIAFFEGARLTAGAVGTFTSALTAATPDTWITFAIKPVPPSAVSADRRVVYSIANIVSADRRVPYSIIASISADRRIVYSIPAVVTADRRVVYSMQGAVAAARQIVYGIASTISTDRAIVYGIASEVGADRAVLYTIQGEVIADRAVVYAIRAVPSTSPLHPHKSVCWIPAGDHPFAPGQVVGLWYADEGAMMYVRQGDLPPGDPLAQGTVIEDGRLPIFFDQGRVLLAAETGGNVNRPPSDTYRVPQPIVRYTVVTLPV